MTLANWKFQSGFLSTVIILYLSKSYSAHIDFTAFAKWGSNGPSVPIINSDGCNLIADTNDFLMNFFSSSVHLMGTTMVKLKVVTNPRHQIQFSWISLSW